MRDPSREQPRASAHSINSAHKRPRRVGRSAIAVDEWTSSSTRRADRDATPLRSCDDPRDRDGYARLLHHAGERIDCVVGAGQRRSTLGAAHPWAIGHRTRVIVASTDVPSVVDP
jgi:hypothetical protein